jgi:ATP-dependent exoDNAse (exonuclease V) alpha subunit
MAEIEINAQFAQVLEFINKTSRAVFLTGKAGTGKTTLLKYIRANTYKQMAVCAPTGVAAINAGGATIHSFFQFPFTPFIPQLKQNGDIDVSAANLPASKYNRQRLAIFRSLELLVIDEISMVRADLLDQIDITLRYTRKRWHLPFGGVQVLLIGDLHQLSPVAQPEEWRVLHTHYKSPYFFDSHVITRHSPVYIELTKVYRQSDAVFIGLLNKVRHDALDEDAKMLLNTRYRGDLSANDYADNITLTTHNRKADEINASNIKVIAGKLYVFEAIVKGTFPEKNYPAAEKLELKVGARVMALKNNPEKNYYNGKTGVITSISDDKIRIKCEEDRSEIVVEREVWNNVSYKVDKATHHLDEEILGTFTQFPLRQAWAITIHKSQGLTFEKVIIDAAEAFSAGQVYVALSRCRSLQGLTLSSRIMNDSLKNDGLVLNFASTRAGATELGSILRHAKAAYMNSLIYELFDFSVQADLRKELAALQQLHSHRIDTAGKTWLQEFFEQFDKLAGVGIKFREQLNNLADISLEPENNPAMQERVAKAAVYFGKEAENLYTSLKNCRIKTESREGGNDFNGVLQLFFESLHIKVVLLKACEEGFRLDAFLKARLNVIYPAIKINIYGSRSANKELKEILYSSLYNDLLMVRDEICHESGRPIYMVANSKTIAELANNLPTTAEQLLHIKGFGKAKVKAFGDIFLQVIRSFCLENGVVSSFDFNSEPKKEKVKKPADSSDTRKKTKQMFDEGLTPQQIAIERNLATGTVLSHLLPFVANGNIDVDKLVNAENQALINEALEGFRKENGLVQLKSMLPESVSYFDIKFVLAGREYTTGYVPED